MKYEVLYTTEHFESGNCVWQGILKSENNYIFYACWHDTAIPRLIVRCSWFPESMLPDVYDIVHRISWHAASQFFYGKGLFHDYDVFYDMTPEDMVRFWALKAFH